MNVICDKCRDTDPGCEQCHGHPYVTCRKAGCVLWMREGHTEWKSAGEVLKEATDKLPNPREYALMAMPMSTHDELLTEGEKRYTGGGVGPWKKSETLDQIDLVFCDNMAQFVIAHSHLGPDFLTLGQCIGRLVEEVRAARSWPTPPKIEPNFKYVKADSESA